MPKRKQIVRYNPNVAALGMMGRTFVNRLSPNTLRTMRRQIRRWRGQLRRRGTSTALIRGTKRRALNYFSPSQNTKRKYKSVTANTAGTTHTTTRMIVRRTPKEQRFLRKLFRTNSQHKLYVQRFGFSFIGAGKNNECTWYSVTHNKFNNIFDYLRGRITAGISTAGLSGSALVSETSTINTPDNFIYLGKSTYNYEIFNPTNYNMTVYIYDLICKQDTPYGISYGGDQTATTSSSPEMCMQASTTSLVNSSSSGGWSIADPTNEVTSAVAANTPDWRTIGMKPTDYFYFNTMWKIKGMKKLVLPPASTHHHVVVYNPKRKISQGTFLYPRVKHESTDKHGVAGLTQSTLFGFEGQIVTERDQERDSGQVGTLPGKLIIKCVRKTNVYNFVQTSTVIRSANNLQQIQYPEIFSDLVIQEPEHT